MPPVAAQSWVRQDVLPIAVSSNDIGVMLMARPHIETCRQYSAVQVSPLVFENACRRQRAYSQLTNSPKKPEKSQWKDNCLHRE